MPNPKGNPNPSPSTRFKPGQSGNPGGRPKRPISDRLRKLAEAPLDGKDRRRLRLPTGSTVGDGIATALAKEALRGKVPAVKEFRESIEGKADQRIEFLSDSFAANAPSISVTIQLIREFYGLEAPEPSQPLLPPDR